METELEPAHSSNLHLRIGGPRGFLRIYILYQLSKKPMSGYDLISELSSLTGGTWQPGSGSIYPILEDLRRLELIEPVSKGKRSKLVYSLTKKGSKELVDEGKAINKMVYEFATRYNKIRLAMAGLVSADNLSKLVIELFRSNRVIWNRIVESRELPDNEVRLLLKEYNLLLDDESQWVKGQLKSLSRRESE
jgi:DNA-binding PadR family transcriptional regulator